MKIDLKKRGAVAEVSISLDELKALRQAAESVGRDVCKYVVQGVEAALDLALKNERDAEAVELELYRQEVTRNHNKWVEDRKKNPPNGKKYRGGKDRDAWGNKIASKA